MKARCYNPRSPGFPAYGGRGIKVCADWQTFVGFLDWALATDYSDDKEIDRIDADGPYVAANCRWVSPRINRTRRELDRGGEYLAALGGLLTTEIVSAAQPNVRPTKLNDGGGLYLHVTPHGKKSWRYRYQIDGREKLLTIGLFPKVSLWDAREVHAIARSQVKRGLDPAALKQSARRRRAREAPSSG